MRATGTLTRQMANRLLMFESVARHRSVGAAAAELDLTPRDAGRSLRELEATMTTRIFARNRDGIGLTQAGEVLHLAVAAGLGAIRKAADRPPPEAATPPPRATV